MNPPHSGVPNVPDELVSACDRGDCVFFSGSGISAQAGYATWVQFLRSIIDQARHDPTLESLQTVTESLGEQIDLGNTALVNDLVLGRVPPARLAEALRAAYGRPSGQLSAISAALRDIRFTSVFTTTWDETVERTFKSREPVVITPADSEIFPQLLRSERFFVVRAAGTLDNLPAPVPVTSDAYRKFLRAYPDFSQFLTTCLMSRTFLFAGISLQSIEDVLSAIDVREWPADRHYALVPWESGIELHEERFASRFGIRLLVYHTTNSYPEVQQSFRTVEAERSRCFIRV